MRGMGDRPRDSQQLFRRLPAVDKWLASASGVSLSAEFSTAEVTEVLRERLDRLRHGLSNGLTELPDFHSPRYEAVVRADLLRRRLPSLRRAINATGIVLHTNLGRAPLAPSAVAAAAEAAQGYSNLELDLNTGRRGSRHNHVESLLCRLAGAEAALAVNNCAAAVMLALGSLAAGREAVISRGELVEIGGSFRMPDIIAGSGARMVEVGTTNKTRIQDYAAAINDETRVLLAVHPSNFRIVGFSSRPALAELAELAHGNGLIFVQDLGSGALVDPRAPAPFAEPTVQGSLAAGTDLVTFSGDKLLGGPQAGIIVGRSKLIDVIRRNPLARALRIDKLSLAALAATLKLYLPPHDPMKEIPVLRMLGESRESIAWRARNLARRLRKIPGLEADIADDVSYGGGGALPMVELPTKAIRVCAAGMTAGGLAQRLRAAEPPVIARLTGDRLALDPRTILPGDAKALMDAFRATLENPDRPRE